MSTASALTPRFRIMAICDRISESKFESGVFHLKGVRQSIIASSFPFVPNRLWLFLLLSSPPRGRFPGYVRVVNDETDKAVFYAHLDPIPVFRADGEQSAVRTSIRCAFPTAGSYTVQVWFFQQYASAVLKGEMPFSIVFEEHDS